MGGKGKRCSAMQHINGREGGALNPRSLSDRLNDWLRKPWVFPVMLGICMVFAYGLQINALGFYWDDWEDIFLYRLNSPLEFLKYFMYDRPTTVWVYLVFFPLLGDDPLKWQIFNLLLRYLSMLGLWLTFCQVWPKRCYEIGWLVLLLAVFPGFFQQTIAVTYSRHFVSLALFSLSLVLTTQSFRYPRQYTLLTLLAAICSFAQMMTIEYFVGLEIIRPVLIWVLIRDSFPDRSKTFWKTLQWWLPYLIPLFGFFAWRFLIFQTVPGTEDPNGVVNMTLLRQDPAGLILHLVQNVIQDCLYMLVFIWTNTIEADEIDLASKAVWFGWVMGAFAAISAGIVLSREKEEIEPEPKEKKRFVRDWLFLGGISVLAGGLPVWITERQVIVGQWSDRFTLGPMIGIAMILVTLISLLGYRRLQKTVVLGLLMALAISTQIRTVNRYRLNWDIQRDYYWQFFWRVPAMKPGTALFGTKMPFGLIGDYSVSYAINTIYAPDMTAQHIPYWFFSSMRAYGNDIPDFIPGLPVSYTIRNLKFTGSTSNGIVPNYKAGQACVRILRPEDEFSPLITSSEARLAQISNLEQILRENPDPRISPESIFGPEPEHNWCYYYEKADLARQFGDWVEIASLKDQAEEKGLSPAVGMEYEPFIEGLAKNGNWEEAYKLSVKANELTDNMGKTLCADWKRLETAAEKSGAQAGEWMDKIRADLQCP